MSPNPDCLLWDSDALIQVFLLKAHSLLDQLKATFRVASAIAPEVEQEILQHQKFGTQFVPALQKALRTGSLLVLDPAQLHTLFPGRFASAQVAQLTGLAISNTGRGYASLVDYGEAYSHASAVILGLPLVSHDGSALQTLILAGRAVASPTLRLMDLVTLLLAQGLVSAGQCNNWCKELRDLEEYLPPAFRSCSFAAGLPTFDRRLCLRGSLPPSPAGTPTHRRMLELVL